MSERPQEGPWCLKHDLTEYVLECPRCVKELVAERDIARETRDRAHAEIERLKAHIAMIAERDNTFKEELKEAIKERDEARRLQQQIARERDLALTERDEARREQNADEGICAQRDQAINERDMLKTQLQAALKETCVRERDEARALCREANRQRDGWRANANRLQNLSDELKNELNHALAELHALRANTTPEPSRLEIAARIMQGWAANPSKYLMSLQDDSKSALRIADALIAAAKEAKP